MDFFTSVKLVGSVDQNLRAATDDALAQAERAMPWAGGMRGQAALLMNGGSFPLVLPAANVTADPQQQTQWNQFRSAFLPLQNAAIAGAREQAAAEGRRLASNTALWESIHRVTLAVATLGTSEAWERLKLELNRIRDARRQVLQAQQAMRTVLADPRATPIRAQVANQLNQITVQQQEIDSGVRRVLGPVDVAEVRAEAGLGMVPAPVAAIAGTVIIGVVAAIAYWVNRQYNLRDMANANAQEALTMRQRVLDDLVKSGKLTPLQWQEASQQNAAQAQLQQESQRSGRELVSKNMIALAAVVAVGVLAVTWLKRRPGGAAA